MNKSEKSEEKSSGVYHEYFEATKKYTLEYGPNTLILMQVGSFYESYGWSQDGKPVGSCIESFTKICELKLAEKSKDRYQGSSLFMAGFGEYNLEKYIKIMTDAGYTAVVFVQTDDMLKPGAKKRVFSAVYSPGTFLSLDEFPTSNLSNNLMVVWVSTYKSALKESRYLCGFSAVNILSGHTYLYEYTTTKIMSPTSFDDLERALSSFTPSEILFLHADPYGEEAEQIIQFTGMSKCTTLHRIPESQEKVQRLSKQTYIDTTLTFYLGDKVATVCQEFTMYEFATRCFVYLLDFLQSHNPHLVQKLDIPIFSNSSSRVILANHTLKQLNMLGSNGVIAFLDGTKTAMGSRLFQYQLQNPTFDTKWLTEQYDAIAWAISLGETKVTAMQRHLSNIRDLERIGRRLLFGKIYPGAIFELYRGIREWSALLNLVSSSSFSFSLQESFLSEEQKQMRIDFMQFMESRLHMAVCEGMNHFDFVETESPLFLPAGATPALLQSLKQLQTAQTRLQSFCQELNKAIQRLAPNKMGLKGSEEWMKIHQTAKSGSSLQLTSIRGNHLRDMIQKHGSKESIQVFDVADPVFLNTFRVVNSAGSAASTVENVHLQTTCKDIIKGQERVLAQSAECFKRFLQELEQTWGSFLTQQAKYIAQFDCMLNKAHKAMQYRYCRPQIVQDGTKGDEPGTGSSWFDAQDLRHVLIEHLQTNEMYVANNLALGCGDKEPKGLLLFGTNAVGKTSLIKAAGIAVLMAQAGMYVPCSQFRYRPYRAVYSRILGNDDIFRGLSTFVVEMSELRVILKSADPYSLVLGDELCSGTETESALSIFVAGLQHLVANKATFVFATHFHEIVHYEEVVALTKKAVQLKHLSVLYDREKETLVYDRILREGSGEAIYGLEVAKSLFMPVDFLEAAFQLRAKYFPAIAKPSPLSCKPSRYNARKIRGMCELCKEKQGDEVHHKVPQHLADAQGFLPGGFVKKNHRANLLSVCEACHDKIHVKE